MEWVEVGLSLLVSLTECARLTLIRYQESMSCKYYIKVIGQFRNVSGEREDSLTENLTI